MSAHRKPLTDLADDESLNRKAQGALTALCQPRAVLAVAQQMEMAVVVRETDTGGSETLERITRDVAEAMALKDWISSNGTGRILKYQITSAGRAALRRMQAEAGLDGAPGFAERQSPFAAQHRDWDERNIMDDAGLRPKRIRYNAAESPLAGLARRRDRNGEPFLSDALVAAGERLREDFELAQMGPRVAQNWDRFLTAGGRGNFDGGSSIGEGPQAARDRVAAALEELGPGLGDMALRCCCYLEGMETAEKRMGWSARSGKIVLRIALQRLRQHYDSLGKYGPLIG